MVSSNKKIVYNTIILYVKLILSVLIGLYTSRLILQALGNSDFGLYSVVGGIVTLLNIVGITMVSTSYRYISVEIGKGEKGEPNRVYNTILVIHLFLALLLVILGLVVGIWYIDNYLNVDPNKINDAKYVMIISMITTAGTVISVPSNGLIIAREKFLFTSLVEISQMTLKLILILFVLCPYGGNRLRLFVELMLVTNWIPPVSYTLYCFFKERNISRWHFNPRWKDYYEVIGFTWWLLISAIACIGLNQGAAMIINIFFGTVINASFGISMQVQSYLQMFPKNILQATNPQIMKSYGEGNYERSLSLVYATTRFCFLIFLVPAIPCLILMDEILKLWLGTVPPNCAVFATYMLWATIIGNLGSGFDGFIQATGRVRINQIGYTIINLSLLPIIYILYSYGFPAYTNAIITIFLMLFTVVFQSYIMKMNSSFKYTEYFKRTIIPAITVVLSLIPLFFLKKYYVPVSLSSMLCVGAFAVFATILSITLFGLKAEERKVLYHYMAKKISTIF